MGTIEILPHTDAGRNLLGLVNSGIRLGISSRGMGSVKTQNDGMGVVQEDLSFACTHAQLDDNRTDRWSDAVIAFGGLSTGSEQPE